MSDFHLKCIEGQDSRNKSSRVQTIRKFVIFPILEHIISQAEIHDNSYFKINEIGVKRLKKYEKSRVKGDNPFAV